MGQSVSLGDKVFSAIRWSAGVRFGSQILTWAMTIVVIRVLTPADYGLLAMASAFVAIAGLLSEVGLGQSIVQQDDLDRETIQRIYGLILVVHALIFIILVGAAPLIADFYGEPRVVPVVRVLSLQFVISAFLVIPNAMLQREMEFRKRSLIDFSSALIGGITTLGLALSGYGVWALVVGSLLSLACKAVGLNIVAPFRHTPRFAFSSLKRNIAFGGQITLSGVLWYFFTQADVLIAGRWLGKELLGFYSVGMHLASLFNQRIAGIVNQVAFPTFARLQRDKEAVVRHTLTGIRLLSFCAFPLLWGLSSVAPEVVVVILGERWIGAIVAVQTLSLIMPLRMIGNFTPNVLQGIGRADILLRNTVWAAILFPLAFLAGVQWGLNGLCIAWLIVSPLVFFQNMLRWAPAIGVTRSQVLGAIGPSFLSAALMYGAVEATRALIVDHWGPTVQLPILICVGAAVYFGVAWAINRSGVEETFRFFRKLATPRTT